MPAAICSHAVRPAREKGDEALKSVARIMRAYALERPILFAATFRTATTDSPEWRESVEQIRKLMTILFAECGVYGGAAEQAQRILRCIVRGFVLHEIMDYFFDPVSYDESFEKAMSVFITGLPTLIQHDERMADRAVTAA